MSNGALEGMNNKVKVISHRAYGYRTTWTYMGEHLPLLRRPPVAVTLLGQEPVFVELPAVVARDMRTPRQSSARGGAVAA